MLRLWIVVGDFASLTREGEAPAEPNWRRGSAGASPSLRAAPSLELC